MNNSKFDYGKFALALSSLNNQQLPCFDSVLGHFQELLESKTDETKDLKKSFVQVRKLVEVWLSNTKGSLHHRILHFKQELDFCLQVVWGLPEKINRFWKKQLTLLCVKIKNLFAQKAEIAMCAKNLDDATILKEFREREFTPEDLEIMKTRKRIVIDCDNEDVPLSVEVVELKIAAPIFPQSTIAMNKTSSIRSILGITEETEKRMAMDDSSQQMQKIVEEIYNYQDGTGPVLKSLSNGPIKIQTMGPDSL